MKECTACRQCFPDQFNNCPTDGAELLSSIAGDTVLDGRYQLERRLGQGGMGIVYRARHIFLKTTYAIKVILPDLVGNDPMLATRFRQEAMVAARIGHRNIVNVTDFGVVGGKMPYLVMDFIQGRSLHELLSVERRLAPQPALEIMAAICAGVGAAHRQGIVHRDLKPLNVMMKEGVPYSEAVKVLDFGLAKIKSGELLGSFVAAQTTGLMGSPSYMAPELWSEDEPDARADIYSLGVILFQMFAGEVPFRGPSLPAIMKKHLSDSPPRFLEVGVNVPHAIEMVVHRSLAKKREDRMASVEEFIHELHAAVASADASSARISMEETREFDPGRLTYPADMDSRTVTPASLEQTSWDSQTPTDSQQRIEDEADRLNREFEEAQRRADEARSRAEEAARKRAEEEAARKRAEEEAARKLAEEEAARRHAEEMARKREQEALERRRAEEEASRKLAAEEARQRAEEEEARKQVEEEAARLAKEIGEAKKRAEEARLIAQSEARKRSEEEVARKRAEEEAQRLAGEVAEAQRRAEEARTRAEEEARKRAEEEEARRAAEEEEDRLRHEESIRIQAEGEEARKLAAQDAQRLAREIAEAQHRAEEAGSRAEEEAAQRAEAEKKRLREEETRRQREAELARVAKANQAAQERKLAQAQAAAKPFPSSQTPRGTESVPLAEETVIRESGKIPRPLETGVPVAPAKRSYAAPIIIGVVLVFIVGLMAGAAVLYSRRQTAKITPTSSPTPARAETPAPKVFKPEMAKIEGGTFQMGLADAPAESLFDLSQYPTRSVNVGSFWIDKTEVTNSEYAEFVAATKYAPPTYWTNGKPPSGQELFPVTYVALADAKAFAAWRSKRDGMKYRLPTEEEWEYAARNGKEGTLYPWGNEWADGSANVGAVSLEPVGSHQQGASRSGVLDLIGNVWEWTSTKAAPYPGNTRFEIPSGQIIIRGGAYLEKARGPEAISATRRSWLSPTDKQAIIGFRLVRE